MRVYYSERYVAAGAAAGPVAGRPAGVLAIRSAAC
jgi:hypothetical protein